MGFLRVAAARRTDFRRVVGRLLEECPRAGIPDLLNALVAEGERVHGEWMGFLRVSAPRRGEVKALVRMLVERDASSGVPDLLNALVANGETVRVVYSTGNWLDIDSLADLVVAGSF
jgi:hypothetical protein